MSATSILPVDTSLLGRMRAAGAKIVWRPTTARAPERWARIAHLHDEEARIEERNESSGAVWISDSGPVGALVLLLEMDRRGFPAIVDAVDAGTDLDFPSGALLARWTEGGPGTVPISDLVALARYALR